MTRRTMLLQLLTFLVTIGTVGGYYALAIRPALVGPTQPAIIATFDLEKTFNALDEKKRSDETLIKLANDLKARGDEMAKALKQIETELEDHVPGGKKHNELLERLSQESGSYQAYIEFCKIKVEAEKSRVTMRIYASIKAAVTQMARENNYAAVFVDDSIAEIPLNLSVEETTRQISARRLVYTSSEIDITDPLISRMNVEFGKTPHTSGAAAP